MRVDPELGESCGDASVLLVAGANLCGAVVAPRTCLGPILAAREIFVVLAVDSRVPLSLLDPHGLAFFGPCLLLRDLTAACSSWVEIRVRVLQQTSY